MTTAQTSLEELFTHHRQLAAEAEKLIVDRAESLLAKVPKSCKTFVRECCSGHDSKAFARWLGYLVTNTFVYGYGCDANMRPPADKWETYGFKTSDEAFDTLKDLEEAWKGVISLHPSVIQHKGEVYAIDVLCKAVEA